jgi:prepilin-type processing-associated H-X9-DG protein
VTALDTLGTNAAGPHEVAFDASGLPPGAYVARLMADGHVAVQRLAIVR